MPDTGNANIFFKEDFMFCTKCGTELNEGSEFCSKCGTKVGLSTEEQNTMNQQNENRPMPTQVVVMPTGTGPLVMGLLGLFGGFIPIVKYITGLLSLLAIFVGASQRKKLKGASLPTGKATAGIVLGTIAVLITVITIAFSAMVIGSLFSGGGSSKSSKRINFFTNTLPKEIQDTVWSNGWENVEFGKNKVKFNHDWHSVKKIIQGTQPGNWMFTWVYFGDYYVTLQHWSNNELRLIRFYREGARIDNFSSGFKTPAEIEAEKIENERIAKENERIAKEIVGVWEGRLNRRLDQIGMKLDITGTNGFYSAVFDFFSLPGTSDFDKGSMRMSVSYISGEYQFKFKEWIVRPRGFDNLDLQGRVSGNVLSGKSSYDNSFNVEKKN